MSILPSVFKDFRKLRPPSRSDQKWLGSRPGCFVFLLGLTTWPKQAKNKQTCNENLVEHCIFLVPLCHCGTFPGRWSHARSLVTLTPTIAGDAHGRWSHPLSLVTPTVTGHSDGRGLRPQSLDNPTPNRRSRSRSLLTPAAAGGATHHWHGGMHEAIKYPLQGRRMAEGPQITEILLCTS